jgi:PmbA protein
VHNFGLGVQVALEREGTMLVGFGQEAGDLTLDGVKRAFDKAVNAAVADPDFYSLPHPKGEGVSISNYHDPEIMALSDQELVRLGWDCVDGGLNVFSKSEALGKDPAELGLIMGGDVTVLKERMAVYSTHMSKPLSDESTLIISSISAMVESKQAKGSGWHVCSFLRDFSPHAAVEATKNSIAVMDGVRIEAGDYPVILGPQPVADLLNNMVIPSLNLGVLYAGSSAFQGKLGRQVAVSSFSLTDDGASPGLAATKGVTCEGLPTGRTELIKQGVMVGTLTNHYESQRMLHNPNAVKLLGCDPKAYPEALVPRNGVRFISGGGRSFSTPPSIASTNVLLQGENPLPLEELMRTIKRGLYIGRIWYTYPMNGLGPGDFTSTIIGDSYLIEEGQISKPIAANTLRIHDNVKRILLSITGYSDRVRPVAVWAADEVVYSPDMAVDSIHLEPIAEFALAT